MDVPRSWPPSLVQIGFRPRRGTVGVWPNLLGLLGLFLVGLGLLGLLFRILISGLP